VSPDLSAAVSIGIATHDAAETVLRALGSALDQSWPNVEIVIVDDSSTDTTWEMVAAFAATHDNVRIGRNTPNGGVAAVRNKIVDLASGEFICFMDDDDTSRPDRVELQVSRILAYEEKHGADLVLCYCGRHVVTGGSISTAPSPIGSVSPEPYGEVVANYVLGVTASGGKRIGGPMGCGTMMARKSTLQRAGLFDEKFRRAEEMDLAVRAALLGAHFISVDQPLITQYKTPSTDKAGTRPLDYALMLRNKHRHYLDKQGLYLASTLFARASFWSSKNQMLKSRLYRALGYLAAPHLVPAYFRRRFGRSA